MKARIFRVPVGAKVDIECTSYKIDGTNLIVVSEKDTGYPADFQLCDSTSVPDAADPYTAIVDVPAQTARKSEISAVAAKPTQTPTKSVAIGEK